MNSISISYTLKWQFKELPHIKISTCKKVFNTKTGRQKKMCVNGGSIGYWLTAKRFVVKKDLNLYIEKIPTYQKTPF